MAAPTKAGVSIVVAGGGTAGHIEPALAIADALRELDPSARVTALGTSKGLETRLVPARGYPLELITPVPLPRKVSADLMRLPLRVIGAVRETRAVLKKVDADVVVGLGGYVALPAYLAAKSLRIPIVMHEANARAGIANKVGARLAAARFAAVPGSGIDAEVVGIPVRAAISALGGQSSAERAGRRTEARAHFGLDPYAPVLLIFGGSQGARSLNAAALGAAPSIAAAGVSVLHAVGPKNATDEPQLDPPYRVVSYLDDMSAAYVAADFALCRAGAMTVAELTAVGIPAAYVPLPIGNGEQALNAGPAVAGGGGLLVADADLTPEWIRENLLPVLADPHRRDAMAAAAVAHGSRNAANLVARRVLELAGHDRGVGGSARGSA